MNTFPWRRRVRRQSCYELDDIRTRCLRLRRAPIPCAAPRRRPFDKSYAQYFAFHSSPCLAMCCKMTDNPSYRRAWNTLAVVCPSRAVSNRLDGRTCAKTRRPFRAYLNNTNTSYASHETLRETTDGVPKTHPRVCHQEACHS